MTPVEAFLATLDAAYPRADMKNSWWLGNGLIELKRRPRPDCITLVGFWVAPNRRNAGHGAAMLDVLCGLADRHGVHIDTWADPYDADRESKRAVPKAPALRAWYARWGFEPVPRWKRGRHPLLLRTARPR